MGDAITASPNPMDVCTYEPTTITANAIANSIHIHHRVAGLQIANPWSMTDRFPPGSPTDAWLQGAGDNTRYALQAPAMHLVVQTVEAMLA